MTDIVENFPRQLQPSTPPSKLLFTSKMMYAVFRVQGAMYSQYTRHSASTKQSFMSHPRGNGIFDTPQHNSVPDVPSVVGETGRFLFNLRLLKNVNRVPFNIAF
jgi:hypothetical protein